MREIEYYVLSGIGNGRELTRGTLKDLLLEMPYVLTVNSAIPPLKVLNSILNSGGHHAGMSGGAEWDPFQIGPEDYAVLVTELEKEGYQQIDSPEWVNSYSDWGIWLMYTFYKVPWQEHLRLSNECDRLSAAMKTARENNDEEMYLELFSQWSVVSNKLSDFIMKNLVRPNN